jgi:uncharacterized protein YjdB
MKTRVVLFIAGTLSAASCGQSSSSCADLAGPGCGHSLVGVESVLVTPTSSTVKVGATVQLTVAVNTTPSNFTYSATWSSSDTTAATVNSTGLVTAKASSSGVAICVTTNATGYANVENCATVVVTP